MTRVQQKRFKSVLETKRGELIREIAERRRSLAAVPEGDAMDQLRSIADRDVTVRSVDGMCALLRSVERALHELENRTFGLCAQCGEAIPSKRLSIVPWSPFCVPCQENAELMRRNAGAPYQGTYAVAS